MARTTKNGFTTQPARRTTYLPGSPSPYLRRGARLPRVGNVKDGPNQGHTTIVIADDHIVVRSGLRMLLDAEPDFEVVAEAGDIDGARRYVRGHKPTVLILDLNLPGDPGLPAIPELRKEYPNTQIVVLTVQGDPA